MLGNDEIVFRYQISIRRQVISVQKLKAENINAYGNQLVKQAVRNVQHRSTDQAHTSNHRQNDGKPFTFFSFRRNIFHKTLFSVNEKILYRKNVAKSIFAA
jgi:hypothetical protein